MFPHFDYHEYHEKVQNMKNIKNVKIWRVRNLLQIFFTLLEFKVEKKENVANLFFVEGGKILLIVNWRTFSFFITKKESFHLD